MIKKSFGLLLLLTMQASQYATAQNAPDFSTAPVNAANYPSVTPPSAYNTGGNTAPTLFNFTRTWVPEIASQSLNASSLSTSGTSLHVSTSYINGLGQPLQTIARRAGSSGDIITTYDNRLDISSVSYLPYSAAADSRFQMSPYSAQKSFYLNLYPGEGDNAYSRTALTSNSGAHTINTFSPGQSFTGNHVGVASATTISDGTEGILIWGVDANGIPSANTSYAAGMLTCKKTTGAHDAESYEYSDKSGRLVYKKVKLTQGASSATWAGTYYVYDDLGRIAVVMTPQAVQAIVNLQPTMILTAASLDGLCYTYKYDKYGQITEKHTPGKTGKESIVYDSKHRPVLSQTPLLYSQGKWAYQVYDSKERVAFSGYVTSSATRQAWQDWADGTVTPGGGVVSGTLLWYFLNGSGTPANYPAAITGCDIDEYSYYDTYSFPAGLPFAGKTFDNSYASDYNAAYQSPAPYYFAQGLQTAKRVRVIGNSALPNQWISTVMFYDNNARPIQILTLNPWNQASWDVSISQYSFTGKTVRTISKHYAPAGMNKPDTKVVTSNNYNAITGSLMNIVQQLDGGPVRTIATYTYNNLGQVTVKDMGNVETQACEYNIRGQLTYINRNYLNSNTPVQDVTFGMGLSYDYGFSQPRLDGTISGFTWKGAGNLARPRAYGYDYDAAGRMTRADFNEYTPIANPGNQNLANWEHQHTDYSVSNIAYDANGNMQSMKQRGMESLTTGSSQPADMDDLTYVYKPSSNTLDRVEDAVTTDYHLYDFVNNNAGTTDYGYDEDGNLTSDANKGITAISYSPQDLPLSVATAANGSIANTYDADGTLLEKTIHPTYQTAPIVYRYWGPYVYRNDSLLYVLNPEGRARWLADSLFFRYDYFVKDHLGNVRTVVTADAGFGITKDYLATHELASALTENLLFDGIADVRGGKQGSTGSNDLSAAVLDGNDPAKRIGTSLMLRVMAGDKFGLKVDAYYDPAEDSLAGADQHTEAPDMLSSIISTLSGGVGGGFSGGEGSSGMTGNGDLISSALNNSNYLDAYDGLQESSTNPDLPRAYLNYLVFDENMVLVPAQSGAVQVTTASYGAWTTIDIPQDITIGQNGTLIVYISNGQHRVVGFDNLNVSYYKGRLLDEQHYYPFGLTMKGASASASPLVNRYLYQGKEMQDEAGLQLYDFHARQYDPQIGRFWGIDPMDQFPSGYTGMGNSPANEVDPTGMAATVSPWQSGGNDHPGSGANGVAVDWNFGDGDMDDIADKLSAELGGGGGGGGGEGEAAQGKESDGQYYGNQGEYIRSDNKNDGKIYLLSMQDALTDDIVGDPNPKTTATELPITKEAFEKAAATVYGESSATMPGAHPELMQEMFSIATIHRNNPGATAFGTTNAAAVDYQSKSPSERNGTRMQTANAAVINALQGGPDYSGGGDHWDGREQGLFPNTDTRKSNGTYILHMNTVGWSINDVLYTKWGRAVGPLFVAPQQHFIKYGDMIGIGYTATAVWNSTIFWKSVNVRY